MNNLIKIIIVVIIAANAFSCQTYQNIKGLENTLLPVTSFDDLVNRLEESINNSDIKLFISLFPLNYEVENDLFEEIVIRNGRSIVPEAFHHLSRFTDIKNDLIRNKYYSSYIAIKQWVGILDNNSTVQFSYLDETAITKTKSQLEGFFSVQALINIEDSKLLESNQIYGDGERTALLCSLSIKNDAQKRIEIVVDVQKIGNSIFIIGLMQR